MGIISRKLVLYSLLLLCGLIIILSLVYFGLRRDRVYGDSLEDYFRAEMTAAAECFIEDTREGNITLAYHHSKYAADFASMCGLTDAALVLDSISKRVLAGELGEDMAQEVRSLAENGYTAVNGGRERDGITETESTTELPLSVSMQRYAAARNTADRIFGGSNIIRRVEKTSSGDLLLSCRNAYALIDARTAVPIEAGISLDAGEMIQTREECIAAAEEFLLLFFSEDAVKSAAVRQITEERERGVCIIEYQLGTRHISMSVKGDNGRIVRFAARQSVADQH